MNILRLLFLFAIPAWSASLQAEPINAPLQPPVTAGAEAGELFDIKGPIEITNNSATLLMASAAAAALLLLGILAYFLWKRSRRQKAVLAHETALQRLVAARQLIEEHNVAAFVTLIDQTLRNYIEQRFAVSARRQTTREFISAITTGTQAVPEPLAQNKTRLQTWLEHCDMVKFARADLSAANMKEMLANLRDFIESTRLEDK